MQLDVYFIFIGIFTCVVKDARRAPDVVKTDFIQGILLPIDGRLIIIVVVNYLFMAIICYKCNGQSDEVVAMQSTVFIWELIY